MEEVDFVDGVVVGRRLEDEAEFDDDDDDDDGDNGGGHFVDGSFQSRFVFVRFVIVQFADGANHSRI